MRCVNKYVTMDEAKTCWQQWCGNLSLWGKLGRRPSISLVEGAQPFVATNLPSSKLWQEEPCQFDDGFAHDQEPNRRLAVGVLDSLERAVDVQLDYEKIVVEQPGFEDGGSDRCVSNPQSLITGKDGMDLRRG